MILRSLASDETLTSWGLYNIIKYDVMGAKYGFDGSVESRVASRCCQINVKKGTKH